MKKDVEVKKNSAKHVSIQKTQPQSTELERVKKVNKHQHNADFIASQQRVYNTKGYPSDLSKGDVPLSEDSSRSAAELGSSSNISTKVKPSELNSVETTKLEALKLAHINAQRPTLVPAIDPASETFDHDSTVYQTALDGRQPVVAESVGLSQDKKVDELAHQTLMSGDVKAGVGAANLDHKTLDVAVGKVNMGDHVSADAGSASLDGKALEDRANQTAVGNHEDAESELESLKSDQHSSVGRAEMGHHGSAVVGSARLGNVLDKAVTEDGIGPQVSAHEGSASLGGETLDDTVGQADLGRQWSKKSGEALLKGHDKNSLATQVTNTEISELAPLANVAASSINDFEKYALPSSLDGRGLSNDDAVGLTGQELQDSLEHQVSMAHQGDVGGGLASLEDQQSLGVGLASMGHYNSAHAGTASLDGKTANQTAGRTEMGVHNSANAGSASLGGKTVDETSGRAEMGHQKSKTKKVSLKGNDQAPVLPISMKPRATVEESVVAAAGVSSTAGIEKSAAQKRLAEKMSKIRSKTDDITFESDALHKSNHKP
jgi:hypothetical protein